MLFLYFFIFFNIIFISDLLSISAILHFFETLIYPFSLFAHFWHLHLFLRFCIFQRNIINSFSQFFSFFLFASSFIIFYIFSNFAFLSLLSFLIFFLFVHFRYFLFFQQICNFAFFSIFSYFCTSSSFPTFSMFGNFALSREQHLFFFSISSFFYLLSLSAIFPFSW